MNPLDDQLNRLFRAAAKAGPAPDPAPPFGMEARVMAVWRDNRSTPIGIWDMGVLVRGLIVAGVIMTVSLLPALSSLSTNPFAEFLQMTDTIVSTTDYSP